MISSKDSDLKENAISSLALLSRNSIHFAKHVVDAGIFPGNESH